MNDTNTELLPATRETSALATARDVTPQPSIGAMLHAVIEKGVSSENIGAVEKMVALYERMQEKEAEKDFARAFVALQAEMPNVKATKVIPSRDGSVRSRFAPYEEIMGQVQPLLQKHGFTVNFSTEFREGRMIKICTLHHISGFSRTNQFAVRIGSGPPNASEAQADGAASTYAKRFVLCDALNIVVDVDSDARNEGAPITAEQADELERRVNLTNTDKGKFLDYAGAKSYAEIHSAKYAILDGYLKKKESRGK